jgi:rare lipoprotein A
MASWYGAEFAGRATASGEVFNPGLLTAAHPTLPFGTMLRVTNRHNNRQVTVRVNDRGPFASARIIDLSQAAAAQLDMLNAGVAPVLVESVSQVALPPAADSSWRQPGAQSAAAPPSQAPSPAQQRSGPYYDEELGGTVLQPLDGSAPIISRNGAEPSRPVQSYQNQNRQDVQNYQNSQVYQPAPNYQVIPGPIIVYQSVPAPAGTQSYGPAVSTAPVYQSPAQPAQAAQPAAPAQPAPPAQAAQTRGPALILPALPQAGSGKNYRIQVGSFRSPRNAVEAFDKLKSAGLNPAYERNGDYYRVVLAGLRPEDVPGTAEKLGAAGFREALIREE